MESFRELEFDEFSGRIIKGKCESDFEYLRLTYFAKELQCHNQVILGMS